VWVCVISGGVAFGFGSCGLGLGGSADTATQDAHARAGLSRGAANGLGMRFALWERRDGGDPL